jgi:uncharacterized membrane protein YphA (DoxX/SURF4 family)
MKLTTVLLWVLKILAAVIMLQTLYFKFTGHEQSVKLFTMLNMEPYGRIGTGVGELIASILILIPATTAIGALMGLGLMSGAIFFHFTTLGVKFDGDYGLFIYGVIVWLCCLIIVIVKREQLLKFLPKRAS